MSTTTESLPNLDVLLDVPVTVSVELGTCQMPMREVLNLAPGAVVHLDKPADAPVDLYVNGKLFARGQVVVVDSSIGVKVAELVGQKT
jgi:flagellar motor switch protein FliN/FliY